MGKENVIQIHNRIMLSNKKNPATQLSEATQMNWKALCKWTKPGKGKYHMISFILEIKPRLSQESKVEMWLPEVG